MLLFGHKLKSQTSRISRQQPLKHEVSYNPGLRRQSGFSHPGHISSQPRKATEARGLTGGAGSTKDPAQCLFPLRVQREILFLAPCSPDRSVTKRNWVGFQCNWISLMAREKNLGRRGWLPGPSAPATSQPGSPCATEGRAERTVPLQGRGSAHSLGSSVSQPIPCVNQPRT